jgi:hypothetical protein
MESADEGSEVIDGRRKGQKRLPLLGVVEAPVRLYSGYCYIELMGPRPAGLLVLRLATICSGKAVRKGGNSIKQHETVTKQ